MSKTTKTLTVAAFTTIATRGALLAKLGIGDKSTAAAKSVAATEKLIAKMRKKSATKKLLASGWAPPKASKKTAAAAKAKPANLTPAQKAWFGISAKDRTARAQKAWATRRLGMKKASKKAA